MEHNFKVIGFDLGYTLAFNQREETYIAFAKEQSVYLSKSEVEQAFHLADKLLMRDFPGVLGKNPETYFPWYLGVVNYNLACRFNLVDQFEYFKSQKSDWIAFPWSREVLEELKSRGYRLALLSNWDKSCRDVLKKLELYDYFEAIIVSSEQGMEKPDKEIFEVLLNEMNCAPHELLYVGDNYYDDAVGSRKAGINTVLINRLGSLGVEEIKNEIDIIKNTKALLTMLERRGSAYASVEIR